MIFSIFRMEKISSKIIIKKQEMGNELCHLSVKEKTYLKETTEPKNNSREVL